MNLSDIFMYGHDLRLFKSDKSSLWFEIPLFCMKSYIIIFLGVWFFISQIRLEKLLCLLKTCKKFANLLFSSWKKEALLRHGNLDN